jgi:hypothetical protein
VLVLSESELSVLEMSVFAELESEPLVSVLS